MQKSNWSISVSVQPRQNQLGPVLHDTSEQRIPVPDADGKTARESEDQAETALRTADVDEGISERKREPKEAPVSTCQGTKSEHNFGHHYERVYFLLVSVLRASFSASVSR